MKPEDCPELDECYRVEMILDHDLLDFQYAGIIRSVCRRCDEANKQASETRRDKKRITESGNGYSPND